MHCNYSWVLLVVIILVQFGVVSEFYRLSENNGWGMSFSLSRVLRRHLITWSETCLPCVLAHFRWSWRAAKLGHYATDVSIRLQHVQTHRRDYFCCPLCLQSGIHCLCCLVALNLTKVWNLKLCIGFLSFFFFFLSFFFFLFLGGGGGVFFLSLFPSLLFLNFFLIFFFLNSVTDLPSTNKGVN